jgi:predicted NUDIX family NTP pyrophosphohydrolase
MPQVSAGLVMYRKSGSSVEIFLVHPGGPFWAKKEEGAWSIPKGLVEKDEDKLGAAKREFAEETSVVPSGPFIDLGDIRQKSGKQVYAWAFEGNCDPPSVKSNTFTLEWPPKSGRMSEFPEIDRGKFFAIAEARRKINPQQAEFVNRLEDRLGKQGLVSS